MKNLYLTGVIVLFIILIIPFFEGFAFGSTIQFLGDSWQFTAIYPLLIMFGILEGVCLTLYIQSVIHSAKNQSSRTFDL